MTEKNLELTLTDQHLDLVERVCHLVNLLRNGAQQWQQKTQLIKGRLTKVREILIRLSSKIVPEGIRISLAEHTSSRNSFVMTYLGIRVIPPYGINSYELTSEFLEFLVLGVSPSDIEALIRQKLTEKKIPMTTLRQERLKKLVEFLSRLSQVNVKVKALEGMDEIVEPLILKLESPRKFISIEDNKVQTIKTLMIKLIHRIYSYSADIQVSDAERDTSICNVLHEGEKLLFILTPTEIDRVIQWVEQILRVTSEALDSVYQLAEQLILDYGSVLLSTLI